jgi:ADP-ribose pyrophosphatase
MQRWQVLRSKVVYDRAPWLRLIEQDVCLPNGQRISNYILAHTREYAMTFALTQDNQVPLVQQYKHGIGQLACDLPAGYLDDGETPRCCAERELLEETGYRANDWQLLSAAVLDMNRGDACAYLFLARGARQVAAPQLDSTEELAVHLYSPAAVRDMVLAGQINGIASVAGILLALGRLGG